MFSSVLFLSALVSTASSEYNLVLYAAGLFENSTFASTTYTAEVAQSGFQTVNLWTLHVTQQADLIYNNYPVVSQGTLNPRYASNGAVPLQSRIEQLKSTTDSQVEHVLFSIGSGGNPPVDYSNIVHVYQNATLKKQLFANFQVLLDLGIDGFDFDNEEFKGVVSLDRDIIQVIVDMAGTFDAMGATILTFAPYNAMSSWNKCLSDIYKTYRKQLIDWWNLQCYGGGANNMAYIGSMWVDDIQQNSAQFGVSNATEFIVPGFSVTGEENGSPVVIQEDFATYASGVVNGGFIWNWPNSEPTGLAKYSDAVTNGLNGRLEE